jgi:hypothetical protein
LFRRRQATKQSKENINNSSILRKWFIAPGHRSLADRAIGSAIRQGAPPTGKAAFFNLSLLEKRRSRPNPGDGAADKRELRNF